MVYGKLKIIGDAPKQHKTRMVLCQCECGTVCVKSLPNLKCGITRSCGCIKKLLAHGDSKSREYRIWTAMKKRCFNSKCEDYFRYGGRGIKICSRWLKYSDFLNDMGRCPEKYTIERINNDGDYEPSNCRWASRKEQSHNRSSCKMVSVGNFNGCLKAACSHFGVSYYTALDRLSSGKSISFVLGISNK